MGQKRSKSADQETSVKRYCVPGTSGDVMERHQEEEEREIDDSLTPIELIEYELTRPTINVQNIGSIIYNSMMNKQMTDDDLKELTGKLAKNVPSMPNINIGTLSDDLSKGSIDSRLVVIGNAFLWNLLKSSMSSVRDKFGHYQFKVSTMNSSLLHQPAIIDFSTTRVRPNQHIIERCPMFERADLFDVYNSVVFRKTGDIHNKAKQFIKAYFNRATYPRCAIWHYSLRQSGSSHKKWLHNLPERIVGNLLSFLLCLSGLESPELDGSVESIDENGSFYLSLGNSDEERQATYASMRQAREQLTTKLRTNVTDALNETREMPFNTHTQELMAPPRGKPLDQHHCVTWRQYETMIKKAEMDPTEENKQAKIDMDFKLKLTFFGQQEEVEEEIDIEGEDVKLT